MTTYTSVLKAVMSCAFLFGVSPYLWSQTVLWNVANGDWSVSGNWSPTGVPGASNSVRVNNGGFLNITSAQASTDLRPGQSGTLDNQVFISSTGSLTTSSSSIVAGAANSLGTVTIDGGQWTSTAGTLTLGAGSGSTGTIHVQNGGQLTYPTISLSNAGGTGNLTVGVVGSGTVSATSSITVGNGGNGDLEVGANGTVTNSGSLVVGTGAAGVGEMTIASGGSVSNTSGGTIGSGAGSSGTVTVSGTWTNSGALIVGSAGSGNLTVLAGGTVSSVGATTIGNTVTTGSGVVLVRGTLTNTGDLRIGEQGSAMLTIGASGAVNANSGSGIAYLARNNPAASGVLNIGGVVNGATPGTAEAAGVLNAAEVQGRASGGTSTLNFNHTGTAYFFTKTGTSPGADILISGATTTVNAYAGKTTLRASNTYAGATVVTGSTAHLVAGHNSAFGTGAVSVGGNGILEVSTGIVMANTTTINAGTLLLSGGTASGATSFGATSGILAGFGTVTSAFTVTSGNSLSPGEGLTLGTLSFGNSLTLASGSFSTFHINAFSPGSFDAASVGSSIAFGGTLNLTFQTGFSTLGTAKLFDAGSYSGAFSTVNVTGLAEGYAATFDTLNGEVSVSVVPEPNGLALLGIILCVLAAHLRRNCHVAHASHTRSLERAI